MDSREKLRAAADAASADAQNLAGLRLIAKAEAKAREARALLRISESRVEELADAVAVYESLRASDIKSIKIPRRAAKGGKSAHTFFALASDWHSCEIVTAAETGGRNKHNQTVGQERAFGYFRDLVRLVKEQQSSFAIQDVVLWLGGDFLVGEMHGIESARSCDLAPLEEVAWVKRLLIGGLDYLLSELDVDKIRVPCNPGNHGRTTLEYRYRKANAYSYEAYLYNDLAVHYRDEKRIQFDVSEEPYKVVDCGGFRLLFHHGHELRFGGGVGGLAVPFRRMFHRVQSTYHQDAMAIGHFHQYGANSGKDALLANGSLVGWNSYAAGKGLPFEPPAQIAGLISHSRRSIGRILPIWTD